MPGPNLPVGLIDVLVKRQQGEQDRQKAIGDVPNMPNTLSVPGVETSAGGMSLGELAGREGSVLRELMTTAKERPGSRSAEQLKQSIGRLSSLMGEIDNLDLTPQPRNFLQKINQRLNRALDINYDARLQARETKIKTELQVSAMQNIIDASAELRQLTKDDPAMEEFRTKMAGEMAELYSEVLRETMANERMMSVERERRFAGLPALTPKERDIYFRSLTEIPTDPSLAQDPLKRAKDLESLLDTFSADDLRQMDLGITDREYNALQEGAKRIKQRQAEERQAKAKAPPTPNEEYSQVVTQAQNLVRASERFTDVTRNVFDEESQTNRITTTKERRPTLNFADAIRQVWTSRLAADPNLESRVGALIQPFLETPTGPSPQDEAISQAEELLRARTANTE